MDEPFEDLQSFRAGAKKHGEELWLVSYADMMTLLFGFFVILFSFSVVDEKTFQEFSKEMSKSLGGEKAEEGSKTQVGMMNESRQIRALQMLIAMLNLGDSVDEGVERLEKQIATESGAATAKEAILAGLKKSQKRGELLSQIQDKPTARDVTIDIMLADAIVFAPGSDVFLPAARPRLHEIAEALATANGLSEIMVVGHTDARPPRGRFTDNWTLSTARATAVAKELIKFGVDERKIRTSGMAHIQPLFPEQTRDGRPITENMARNRRVHILVKKVQDAALSH